ncbi:UrcA family protein [Caulobacter sp. S45]|uniref:UrcA family protein n=1 Tax=Caulobacter sp. S45 TaxID=1641861 RepID=UPI001576C219|nr:UrcA family protein [Caulobacter sp. S45]
MSKVLNTLSAIGALVMVATPLVAIGGLAHAETGVQPVHIMVGDLNLSQAAGAATFRQRVDIASEQFCTSRGEISLGGVNSCRQAFREEAVDGLGAQQRQDLRSSQTTSRTSWAMASR